ncbi:alkaline ceramidase 3 [Choanephora cucurbitarum]|nr:alkaline ceramidase 3 [Choanephora cucurbitarum]
MTTVHPDNYYWGQVTSTIDWCEENYAVSPYLAEFFNTTTNLGFLFTSLFGIYNIWRNGSNKALILAYLGVIFVGFGSWCFHMTLQYEMQLLDELPMIYVASIVMWLTFLADPSSPNSYKVPFALTLYSAIVTWSYLLINNPVFHQVCYAALILTIVYRSIVLHQQIPKDMTYERSRMQSILWMSAFGFIIAFVLWNIDNVFCHHLRAWRHTVPLVIGALSELHGWWHIGTAIGCYYFIVFCEWIEPTLSRNDDTNYTLYWFGPLCYLRPNDNKKKQ